MGYHPGRLTVALVPVRPLVSGFLVDHRLLIDSQEDDSLRAEQHGKVYGLIAAIPAMCQRIRSIREQMFRIPPDIMEAFNDGIGHVGDGGNDPTK